MQDLKNTTIGGKSITLKRVPARSARQLQTLLMGLVAEPLVEIFNSDSKGNGDLSQLGKQITEGIAAFLPKLTDEQLDNLIDKCKPFIVVDGKPFDEDAQFDADSLFDMYEVIWYFLKETFENFIIAAQLRFEKSAVTVA